MEQGCRQCVRLIIDTGRRGPRRGRAKAGYLMATQTSAGPAERWDFKTYEDATEHESLMHILCESLGRLRVPCRLTIYTESEYLYAVLTDWIWRWQQDGWTNRHKKPVAGEWMQIKEHLDRHKYSAALHEHTEYTDWLHTEVMRKEKKGEAACLTHSGSLARQKS